MRYRFKKDDVTVVRNDDGSLTLIIVLNNQYIHHRYFGFTKELALKYFQKDFGTYPKDFKPVGTLCLCNHGGIAIMEIEHGINEYVVVCDNYGNGYENITRNMVKYDSKGNAYFVRYKQRYYLNDFIRC